MTFLEALPISSITSSTRLGTIVGTALAVLKESSKDFYPPQQAWNISKNDSDDPFNDQDSSEEIISTVRRPKRPPTPLSDSCDLDGSGPDRNGGPPQSSKRSLPVPTPPKEDPTPKCYHFDMKLKPETVQLGTEMKILSLGGLRKLDSQPTPLLIYLRNQEIPQRFTNSAETWYYSIPPKDWQPMEQDWGTLKTAIVDYWINHSWIEDQKFQANNA